MLREIHVDHILLTDNCVCVEGGGGGGGVGVFTGLPLANSFQVYFILSISTGEYSTLYNSFNQYHHLMVDPSSVSVFLMSVNVSLVLVNLS